MTCYDSDSDVKCQWPSVHDTSRISRFSIVSGRSRNCGPRRSIVVTEGNGCDLHEELSVQVMDYKCRMASSAPKLSTSLQFVARAANATLGNKVKVLHLYRSADLTNPNQIF